MFDFDNPVFVHYAIAAALMALKYLGQGWITVYRMIRSNAGLLNPEDLNKTISNPDPHPDQLKPNDYVERSRRMHRNDVENIPAFFAAGLLFVVAAPPLWLALVAFYGFVAARLLHFWAYGTAQAHEVRAVFYSIGSLLTIFMALYVLYAAIAAL